VSCYVVEHDTGVLLPIEARYVVHCYVLERDAGVLLRSGARYMCLVT